MICAVETKIDERFRPIIIFCLKDNFAEALCNYSCAQKHAAAR